MVNVDNRSAAKDIFPLFNISLASVVLVASLKTKSYGHKQELYPSVEGCFSFSNSSGGIRSTRLRRKGTY